MKLIIPLIFSFYLFASGKLPILKCETINSSGTFHSFIQPYLGSKLTIDLNKPNKIINGDMIKFTPRGYIVLPKNAELLLQRIPRGSHDQGGWSLTSIRMSRDFRIELIKTNHQWLAWMSDRDLPAPGAISYASMSCHTD